MAKRTIFPKPGDVWDWRSDVSYSYLYSEFGPQMVEIALRQPAPYRVDEHFHPHFELLYILKGRRCVKMNGSDLIAGPGDVIIFRPGQRHSESHASASISYVALRFKEERLARSGVELPPEEPLGPIVHVGKNKAFLDLLTRMHEEQNGGGENSGLMLNACLIEFVILLRRAMLELIAKKTGQPPDHRRVQAAVDFIRSNLDRLPSLAELARKSFMSPSHFTHVFKAEVGLSPRDFIVAARIEKAKRLLSESDLPAQEIAAMLGYDSPYFFYRQFKQKTGVTALAFRAGQR